MLAIRRLLAQRYPALLLCVATLLLKLLVPSGYMIGSDHGRVAIELCSGVASQPVEMSSMNGDMPDQGRASDHGKAEMPCAFSGLSAAALGMIDPVQLVALIAFMMAVGFCANLLPAVVRRTHLRPPLRGPPALP